MVTLMSFGRLGRGRGDKRAQQALAAAVVARITGVDDGADAVRRALARTELERPVRKLAIVDVADVRLAEGIAAALRDERSVDAGRADVIGLDGVDAVLAVVPAALTPSDAVLQLERVRNLLLGVILVGAAPSVSAREPAASDGHDPLEALSALENAAGPVEARLISMPAPTPSPEPTRKPKPPPAAADAESATIVRELSHVSLQEALALTALAAVKDPPRADRYKTRWLQRFLEERPDMTIADVALATSSLATLGSTSHDVAHEALLALIDVRRG